MRRDAWRCKPCNKQAFPSEARALSTIQYIQVVSDAKRVPKRAYACPHGNGYHLTSKEERRTA